MEIKSFSETQCIIYADIEKGQNFALLNGMPGFKKWKDREVVFRPTGANISYINEHWPDAKWIGTATKWLDEFIQHNADAEKVRIEKEKAVAGFSEQFDYKRVPMDHQRKAFLLSRTLPYFGLFMEQGTGKTKVILDTAAYLYSIGEIDTLGIIAWPNGVHRNWIDVELPKDLPDWVPYRAAFWSANHTKLKVRELESVMEAKDCLRIIAFNAEAFTSDKAQAFALRFVGSGKTLLAIDQSACIKNPQAVRTKFLTKKLGPLAKYRRILDGAPTAEDAGELYSQFLFLDQKIIGHDTWTSFRNEYCDKGFFNETRGYKNMPKLQGLISDYSFRVLEKDCLDLPARIYKRWRFDLSPEEKRIYDEIKKKSLSEFEGQELSIQLPLVKHLRLKQIASGWFPAAEARTIENEPSRLTAFKQLLPILTAKTIIYSRFKADIYLLEKELGSSAVSYHGDISDDDRADALDRFRNDKNIQWLIGQPRSVGIGHTLSEAEFIVFYTNDSSLRFREESEKRAHRPGQTKRLKIFDLTANGTSDNKDLVSLKRKKDVSAEVMKDPINYFLVEEDEVDE